MKKILLLMGILPLLTVTGCIGYNLKHSLVHENQKIKSIPLAQEEEGTGGNPEVYIAHQCLKNQSTQTCLEKLFSDERKAYIQSFESIKLAGRGSSIEKATIELKNDDLFLLYLDTSKVKRPLSINIKSAQISKDKNSMLFILPVKEIGQEIIIKDKKSDILLKYKVLRE